MEYFSFGWVLTYGALRQARYLPYSKQILDIIISSVEPFGQEGS
jgi:hypothetical protein